MPEPITLALGIAIGKLLLRWADLNDSADALADARAGFSALKALRAQGATDSVSKAVTDRLEQRLSGVRDPRRREQMSIAVGNVAVLFAGLADEDIRTAAQHPQGFSDYLARGPGQGLLLQTEEALTPFTRQLMDAGAEVFAELAPRSGRFAAAALLRLLDQVDAAVVGVAGLHNDLTNARAELFAATNRVEDSVDALHPKVDRILDRVGQSNATESAVTASLRATQEGVTLGPPIAQWDPKDLGVHASITVDDETTLTPYLVRDHDRHLREHLAQAGELDRPSFALLVGTSCTGKTRTLYEAVLDALPNWALTSPRTDTDLARLLLNGVPSSTIVWLDELQDRLTATSDGITASRFIQELSRTKGVGPIVFVGTIWPTNLGAMKSRPSPEEAQRGAGAIRDVLASAVVIYVPESFTGAELADSNLRDPRLQKAVKTAALTARPNEGRAITQVLAGGTQLVNRLYPASGSLPEDVFSPAARAVLIACGDLRRVGLPNPLLRTAIEAAAPGYLDSPQPSSSWVPSALDETTHAAKNDDPLTGARTLDIHAEGVPALTPHWATTSGGNVAEGYELHDYLYQDHVARNRFNPVNRSIWNHLMKHADQVPNVIWLANAAMHRGLLSIAITLLRGESANKKPERDHRLAMALAHRVNDEDLAELRAMKLRGDTFASKKLAQALGRRATDPDIAELRSLAEEYSGSQVSFENALARRGTPEDLAELLVLGQSGRAHALYLIGSRKGRPGRAEVQIRRLRPLAAQGRLAAAHQLAQALARRATDSDLAELRGLAVSGTGGLALLRALRARHPGRRIVELDHEGDPVLEARADGSSAKAQRRP